MSLPQTDQTESPKSNLGSHPNRSYLKPKSVFPYALLYPPLLLVSSCPWCFCTGLPPSHHQTVRRNLFDKACALLPIDPPPKEGISPCRDTDASFRLKHLNAQILFQFFFPSFLSRFFSDLYLAQPLKKGISHFKKP